MHPSQPISVIFHPFQLPTCRQLTWVINLSEGRYHLYPPLPFSLAQLKCWNSFFPVKKPCSRNYYYFASDRLTPRDFNSYGSRRGNDEVMARGTFANIRLFNKLVGQTGPKTVHIPSGEMVSCCCLFLTCVTSVKPYYYHN